MILVVGLSPAWQRTIELSKLQVGAVNRASRVSETPSGKAINVGQVASQLGSKVKVLTVEGGEQGKRLLRALKGSKFDVEAVHVKANTRICQTLLNGKVATEIVEESGKLRPSEVRSFITLYKANLPKAKIVVITGSVPDGCNNDIYSQFIKLAHKVKIPVFLDAQRRQLIAGVRAGADLIRINTTELAEATKTRQSGSRTLSKAICQLGAQADAWVVVSDGPGDIVLFRNGVCVRRFSAPKVKVVNPIGCGDAMLAGIAHQYCIRRDMLNAIQLGIASGAANALTSLPGELKLNDVRKLIKSYS